MAVKGLTNAFVLLAQRRIITGALCQCLFNVGPASLDSGPTLNQHWATYRDSWVVCVTHT